MARWMSLWVAALFCFSSVASGATTVTLKFHGPQGERVRLTRAETLISGWGYADEKDLPTVADTLRLVLDPTSATSLGNKLAEAESTFLYVEAAGYASWRSDAFRWPSADAFEPIRIVLGEGRQLIVSPNENANVEIQLRKPIDRRITLLDEAGRPAVGIPIEVSMFWSNEDHCGYFSGFHTLTTSRTNARGTVVVPDVDSEYGLRLRAEFQAHLEFVNHETWPYQFVLRLDAAETTVRVHRYRRTPLRLKVVDRGMPVKGAVFMTDLQIGTCGAGAGPIGVSDAEGIISVADFYAEDWPFAAICYANNQWWEGSPDDVPQTLDIATLTGKPFYLCGP
jgi:hypothetical protein